LVETSVSLAGQPAGGTQPYVYAQGFVTRQGRRKVLLVNKRDRAYPILLPQSAGAEVSYVDQTTGSQPPGAGRLAGNEVMLRGLAVAVVTLPE
jgi:hypothetical protein